MDEEEFSFCCKGCQVVFFILQAQNALENYEEHPVFRQALHAGLITNPDFLLSKKEENALPKEEFQKIHLVIDEMWCPSCAQVIHLILLREKGVKSCLVDYSTDLAAIEYTPRLISKEKIIRIITQLGYHPHYLQDPRKEGISRSLMLRFIIAAFFSLNIMMFSYPIYASYFDHESEGYAQLFAWLSLAGALPVLFYSAWPIWLRFYTGLRVGIWGMEALVCIGVLAAVGLSLYELSTGSEYVYFDSMSVIIVFVLLGKMIESQAKFSAKDALVKLSMALPKKGRKRFNSNEERFVSIKEIHPGDYLVVCMGEKIVLDGIVHEGNGSCDESVMTGEALPVPKILGSSVLAGSIVQQGHLVIRVTALAENSSLNRIMDMISQEIDHKSHYVRAADKIVKKFVPFVITLAFFTGLCCLIFEISDKNQTIWQTAVIRMVSILLISCPCAIGIAAPLAESYLLNALAKMGILVRNRGALPFLGQETLFVFDKTGTVTEGHFEIHGGLKELSPTDQQALKGLTAHSMHPISMAIHQKLACASLKFEKTEEIIGKGIKGLLNNEQYYLGSEAFLKQEHVNLIKAPEEEPQLLTTVYFAKGKTCLTALSLGDSLKTDIQAFIESLKNVKTLLVSGDAESPVKKVANICQIAEWHSGYHPLEKKALIDQLKRNGEIVAMMGDGINDAPALMSAHISIAVFSASDISIQVSDLLLTTTRFEALSKMKKVALLGHQIVKQNLFWAFFYNIIGLGLAVFGMLTPLFSAFAMVSSSLIVLFNARRIGSFAPQTKNL